VKFLPNKLIKLIPLVEMTPPSTPAELLVNTELVISAIAGASNPKTPHFYYKNNDRRIQTNVIEVLKLYPLHDKNNRRIKLKKRLAEALSIAINNASTAISATVDN
jgi:hypothetical protein